MKDYIDILDTCLIEAPVDFLGTGSSLSAANKQEREWKKAWKGAIKELSAEQLNHTNEIQEHEQENAALRDKLANYKTFAAQELFLRNKEIQELKENAALTHKIENELVIKLAGADIKIDRQKEKIAAMVKWIEVLESRVSIESIPSQLRELRDKAI